MDFDPPPVDGATQLARAEAFRNLASQTPESRGNRISILLQLVNCMNIEWMKQGRHLARFRDIAPAGSADVLDELAPEIQQELAANSLKFSQHGDRIEAITEQLAALRQSYEHLQSQQTAMELSLNTFQNAKAVATSQVELLENLINGSGLKTPQDAEFLAKVLENRVLISDLLGLVNDPKKLEYLKLLDTWSVEKIDKLLNTAVAPTPDDIETSAPQLPQEGQSGTFNGQQEETSKAPKTRSSRRNVPKAIDHFFERWRYFETLCRKHAPKHPTLFIESFINCQEYRVAGMVQRALRKHKADKVRDRLPSAPYKTTGAVRTLDVGGLCWQDVVDALEQEDYFAWIKELKRGSN